MNEKYSAAEITTAIQQLRYLGWRELAPQFGDRVVQMIEEQKRNQANKADVAQGAAQELMADLADFNLDDPDNCRWTAQEVFDIVLRWAERHGVDADGGIL